MTYAKQPSSRLERGTDGIIEFDAAVAPLFVNHVFIP
jgi:hypothetical protein